MQTPISYAPPLPWYRGQRVQRVLIRLVILAAVLCGATWCFRFAQQVHFLLQQRRAMSFTMAPDRVILAQGTADVPTLLKSSGYHPLVRSAFDVPGKLPNAVADLPGSMQQQWMVNQTCVFLHGRRAKPRSERLVMITAGPVDPFAPDAVEFGLFAATQVPATLRPGSRPIDCISWGRAGSVDFPRSKAIRIFAAQADPADESHFTIRCEIDQQPEMIDGWLMPDDTVRLDPRH